MQDINPCFATSCVFMMLNSDILTLHITISTKPVELLDRITKRALSPTLSSISARDCLNCPVSHAWCVTLLTRHFVSATD